MKDIFFEIMQDVLEDKVLYGSDWTPDTNEAGNMIRFARCSGKQSRISESNLEVCMDNVRRAFCLAGESALDSARVWENRMAKAGVSLSHYAENMYKVKPLEGDSGTLFSLDVDSLYPYVMEEVQTGPKTRRERCNRCSNMKKKELKRYDSCPECGRSLFALKGRGW